MSRVPLGSIRDIFAEFGAEPVLENEPAESIEDLTNEMAPPKPEPSVADIFAGFGAEPVEPSPVETPAEPVKPAFESKMGLDKDLSAMRAEHKMLTEMDQNSPTVRRLQAGFGDRWAELQKQMELEELGQTITLDGKPIGDLPNFNQQIIPLRAAGEAAARWMGTFKTTALRVAGREQEALDNTRALNMLQRYNSLLNEDSVLGKTAGPLFGEIASTIGVGTLSGVSSGPLGVAGYFALDSFNNSIEEGVTNNLSPKETAVHATVNAAVTFGTVLGGGALAKKMGGTAGEGIEMYVGRATEKLFSKAGLTKLAVTQGIESFEEGFETLASGIEGVRAGTTDGETILDDTLRAATMGAVVGGGSHLGTRAASALQYSPNAEHMKSVLDGWVKRVKGNPVPEAPTVQESSKSNYGETPDGKFVDQRVVDQELHVLQELEKEINSQYEDGGAKELKQAIIERRELAKSNKQDVADLIAQRPKMSPNQRRNADIRLDMLNQERTALEDGLATDHALLAEWEAEFEEVHRGEREFLDAELERISELKALPDPQPKVEAEPDAGTDTEAGTKPEAKPEAEAKPAPPKASKVPEAKGPDALKGAANSIKNRDVNKVRDFFGLENIPSRKRQSNAESLVKAREQGLPDRALEMAHNSLETGELMTDVQTAGVQIAYVQKFDDLEISNTLLSSEPDAHQDVITRRERHNNELLNDIGIMTEALIKNGTELGAALQAQKRMLGESYSPERILAKAARRKAKANPKPQKPRKPRDPNAEVKPRKPRDPNAEVKPRKPRKPGDNKPRKKPTEDPVRKPRGESGPGFFVKNEENLAAKLTPAEVKELMGLAQDVKDAAEMRGIFDKGTEEYNRADFKLAAAMTAYDQVMRGPSPGGKILAMVEAMNAFRMARTLSGDLVPIGRQGFITTFTQFGQSVENAKGFHKVLASLTADEAEYKAFISDRKLAELPNFHVLTKKYGVPLSSKHTKYNDVEGSVLARSGQALDALLPESVRKKRDKLFEKTGGVPLAQFEFAYQAWLNDTRVRMADIAYEANIDLLSQKGGEVEMQKIIDNVMMSTGHVKTNLGPVGQVFLTAPRYMLSRMFLPYKALQHMPKGLWDTVQGKKSSSRFIAGQMVHAMAGASALAVSMKEMAEVFYGEDAVELDWNPVSRGFGYMTINNWRFDMTGGTGFAIRIGNRALQGAAETLVPDALGGFDDGEAATDTSNIIGGVLEGRASPIARDVVYLTQNGVPAGEREEQALAEYILRSMTFLSWQHAHKVLIDQGVPKAVAPTMLEMYGFGGHKKSLPKQRKPKIKF